MRARAIPSGDESTLCRIRLSFRHQLLESLHRVHSLYACGVRFRSDDKKVVIGNYYALHTIAIGDEFFLGGFVMDGESVHIASGAPLYCLARTGVKYIQFYIVLILKHLLQITPEASVIEAGGSCHPEPSLRLQGGHTA